MNTIRIPTLLFAFVLVGCGDDGGGDTGGGDETSGGTEANGVTSNGGAEDSTGATPSTVGEDTTGTEPGSTGGGGESSTSSTTAAETEDGSSSTTDGGSETGDSSGGEFTLMSAEFMDGETIPDAHTCASGDFFGAPAPTLSWSGAPAGTQSFALVMLDQTLVDEMSPLGYHSAFWNLPADVTELPMDFNAEPEQYFGSAHINNGYLGPCPDEEPAHTYVFTLYALPEASITLGMMLNDDFIQTLEDAAIGTATLSGTSSAMMTQ